MGNFPFVRLNGYEKNLFDVVAEVVLVQYSTNLRRRTELLERLNAYTFCTAIVIMQQTDDTSSVQELSECLRRIFTVNLRSVFSEMDVLYPLT